MKNSILKLTAITLITFCNLNMSAQVNNSAKIIKKPGNLSAQSASVNSPITVSNANGVSNEYLAAASNVLISAAPGLSDFRLWYNNGDHKVRTIGILHQQGGMLAKYSDQNGDDPFRVDARWVNIPGATGGTITAAGSGTFNIQLPAKPANTTLVLSGFAFERQAGTDNNIRTISIKMDQETSVAQVSFIDDQREDYRSIVEPTMTGGVLGLIPFGTLVGSGMSMEAIIKGIINEGKNTARPYVATIQYAFIPNSRVTSSGSVSGTNRQNTYIHGPIPNYGPMVYRGFVLRFNNSDHHLLGIGIHLKGLAKFPGQRGGVDEPITYQDNNTDDPIQWYVDYTLLK